MGNTPLPASPFSTESAHRWDYLSASVGFPSALLLLWESAVISLMIMELSASVRPVSDRFHVCTHVLGSSLHSRKNYTVADVHSLFQALYFGKLKM